MSLSDLPTEGAHLAGGGQWSPPEVMYLALRARFLFDKDFTGRNSHPWEGAAVGPFPGLGVNGNATATDSDGELRVRFLDEG